MTEEPGVKFRRYRKHADRDRKSTGMIDGSTVTIQLGDITQIPADAYVVSQSPSGKSYGSLHRKLEEMGASIGLNEYRERAPKENSLFGNAILTKSGGGNAKFLLHAVCKDSARGNEFKHVRRAFYYALIEADRENLTTIVVPALGTSGTLTDKQSAEAMMLALHQYNEAEKKPLNVIFVLYGDRAAHEAFKKVLKNQSYLTTQDCPGKRKCSTEYSQVLEEFHSDSNDRRYTMMVNGTRFSTNTDGDKNR